MTSKIVSLTKQLRKDIRAVTALEYGLIAAAVVAVGLAGFSLIGENLKGKFDSVQTEINRSS